MEMVWKISFVLWGSNFLAVPTQTMALELLDKVISCLSYISSEVPFNHNPYFRPVELLRTPVEEFYHQYKDRDYLSRTDILDEFHLQVYFFGCYICFNLVSLSKFDYCLITKLMRSAQSLLLCDLFISARHSTEIKHRLL